MADYFETKRPIMSGEMNAAGNLSVFSITQILQYLATARAQEYGYDRDTFLKNNNAFWVVSKIRISYKKSPSVNENVLLKTWPLKPGKLIMPRNYQIIGEDGEVCIDAASEWCVLDFESHRPRRVSSTTIDTSDDYLTDTVDIGEFSKLNETVTDTDKVYDRKIMLTDIDENMHTNNCVYARIVMDCLDLDFLINNKIKAFEIHYVNETKIGDILTLYKKQTEAGYYIEAKCGDKIAVRALIEI